MKTLLIIGVAAVLAITAGVAVSDQVANKPQTAPPKPGYSYVVPDTPTYAPAGGYENPAPGNDGSYDCPPGGGPVYVGSSDPAGLDGDGDGIGCE